MATSIKSPFEGEPATIQGVDNGTDYMAVTINYLAPAEALKADAVSWVCCVCLCIQGGAFLFRPEAGVAPAFAVAMLAAGLFGRRLLSLWLRKRATVVVTFTEDALYIGHGTGADEIFDRTLPHGFSVLQHDKTQDERDQHDYERQRAQIGQRAYVPTRYYTASYILVYEQMGQRNDVIEIMGHKEAAAILARLVLCDKVMDSKRQTGKGLPLDPRAEWPAQAGDIPQTVH